MPVPPVISTVPEESKLGSSCSRALALGIRDSRGTSTAPSLIASCDSPPASALASARRELSCESRSTSTNRPGFSAWAERSRPHSGACSSPGSCSPARAATAPWVTNASRESANRASTCELVRGSEQRLRTRRIRAHWLWRAVDEHDRGERTTVCEQRAQGRQIGMSVGRHPDAAKRGSQRRALAAQDRHATHVLLGGRGRAGVPLHRQQRTAAAASGGAQLLG